jgi:hypothetical protein
MKHLNLHSPYNLLKKNLEVFLDGSFYAIMRLQNKQ